jgi:hypothetical protein
MHLLVPPDHRRPRLVDAGAVAALLGELEPVVADTVVVVHLDDDARLRCLVTLDDVPLPGLLDDADPVLRVAAASGAERLWMVTVGRHDAGPIDVELLAAVRRAAVPAGIVVLDWLLLDGGEVASVDDYEATWSRRASP